MDAFNLIIEHMISAHILLWIALGGVLSLWFVGWLFALTLDRLKATFNIFRFFLEYLIYRKMFKEYLKEKDLPTNTPLD